ncbi:MAG: rRNA maturation RNase YbeY [Chitinophagaceae bacterium]|nr:rRNA maturation RNase YbeY [Chitinophagaceae bacterium]MBK8953901.1 rRNA maturation RNase YbeY [Chitinophagaceae bacterium]
MSSQPKVCFFFEKRDFSLANRTQLKRFIARIFSRHKRQLASLNYIFCSDKRLLEINRQFLQHNFLTDIITFELSVGGPIEAEIYISIDRVRDNAEELRVSFKSELHRVMFHGVLHLCGHGDKGEEQEQNMRKMENLYMNQYFMERFP